MKRLPHCLLDLSVGCLALACSSSPGNTARPDVVDAAAADPSVYDSTTLLEVAVPESGRVYVQLAEPALVAPREPADSSEWDLAFDGYDLFSNSGPSGSGQGAAFGPLDVSDLRRDTVPEVPFLSPDKAGGAFVDWYAYDGSRHALYSRFHVYGIKRGDLLWKVQIASYYSEQDNAPVSGLYRIRYASLVKDAGETREVQVDGSAGGITGTGSEPSGCLDLESGLVTQLTSVAARGSQAWDLCFRRDSISVNGEVGGPRGVGATDLHASETSDETLADIRVQSEAEARVRFEAVSAASFEGAQFRGDHVVSGFETGVWVEPESSPRAPARAAWLVQAAAGEQKYLVAFDAFREPTTSSPGTVVLHVKPVKQ